MTTFKSLHRALPNLALTVTVLGAAGSFALLSACSNDSACAETRSCSNSSPTEAPSGDAPRGVLDAGGSPSDGRTPVATSPADGAATDGKTVPSSVGDARADAADGGALACPAGFADCNGKRDDGCEVDVTHDPDHCGACGSPCARAGTTVRACDARACRPVCDNSHLDCNGDGSDGCEVDISTDPDHCGTCTHACGVTGVSTRACAGGVCKPACDLTHLDCNLNGDDGCEVDISTDKDNCGSCGHKCALGGATARACVDGICKPTCSGSSGDCSTPKAPAADDGCETNLVTDARNCGECGRDCLEGTCSSAQCQPAELVTGLSLGGELTADSAYVHWIEGSVVARTPVSGIGVTPVVQNQSGAFDIVSDGTFVYWIKPNTKTSAPYDGAVRRLTSGQTDVAEVVTGINTYAIAADGKNLYWANASDGKIYQAGRDGKGARPISPALDGALTLAVDRTSTFAGLAGSSVVGFAEVPIGGGSLVETTAPYTTPSIEPYKLALDSTHIYSWGYDSANDRTVLIQTPKTLQGNPTIMTGSTTDALLGIASDANFVYFGQSDGIYRIPFASGTPHFLAATKQPVNSLATTNGALFWIDPPAPSSTSGRVMKLAVFPN